MSKIERQIIHVNTDIARRLTQELSILDGIPYQAECGWRPQSHAKEINDRDRCRVQASNSIDVFKLQALLVTGYIN